jgi:DNA-binding CsgD family transcriptional regulator
VTSTDTVEGRVLEILGDLQEAMDLAELRQALVPAIRAVIPSDAASLRVVSLTPAIRRLPIHRAVYAPVGVGHQLAFTLPSAHGEMLAVALVREDEPFTEDERAALDRARPFLIQLYRNATALTALRLAAEQRRPESVERRLAGAGLTRREAEIVRLVASGASNAQIADELTVSVRTVHKHLENAFRKLGVRSRSEAAAQVWSA